MRAENLRGVVMSRREFIKGMVLFALAFPGGISLRAMQWGGAARFVYAAKFAEYPGPTVRLAAVMGRDHSRLAG